MASLNRVTLIGNLGKDPEVRYTKTQVPFARFSLATTEEYTAGSGEKVKKTTWHNIVVWGKQAEIAQRYLRKGKQIYVEGRIENRDYEDQQGQKRYITDIRADRFLMLGSAGGGGQMDQGSDYGPEMDQDPAGYGEPQGYGSAPAGGGRGGYGQVAPQRSGAYEAPKPMGYGDAPKPVNYNRGGARPAEEPMSFDTPESDHFSDDDIPF